jgi:hypothetical protein
MITALIILSSLLTVVSAIPYIVAIIRGTTKPRVVSWLIWSVLTAIAGVASYADGQYAAAILMLFVTLETLAVVVLGLKHGDRKFARLDIVCLLGAAAGIILWQIFDSPAFAVLATLLIDLLGGIPTLVHSWRKPFEETWQTYALSSLASVCTVIAAGNWQITSVAFPLYLVAINLVLAVLLLLRRRAIGAVGA